MAERNDWEMSKENIQPLERGRRPNVLKVALSSSPEDIILQQRQVFENELRSYTGDDLLSIWCKYINWVEQNFPKGGKDGHLEQLIQQCLTIFKDENKYYDDDRFIQIWLKYANMSPVPQEVYSYMYSHKIGCKSAKFFIAWSWELEQKGIINKADKVLNEGVRRLAAPVERLKEYFTQFEHRIALNIKKETSQDLESQRSAFTLLKPINKKNAAPAVRSGSVSIKSALTIGRQQPMPKATALSGNVPFKINNAENIVPVLPLESENAPPYILSSDNMKENEKKPSKWNKVRAKQAFRIQLNSDPGFKMHFDETSEPNLTPRTAHKLPNVLQTRTEKITSLPPAALFEPPDPMKKPMYDKEKVYGGAEEFSFEEIRAVTWFKNRKNSGLTKSLTQEPCEKIAKTFKQETDVPSNSKAEIKLSNFSKIPYSRELFPKTDSLVTSKNGEIYASSLAHPLSDNLDDRKIVSDFQKELQDQVIDENAHPSRACRLNNSKDNEQVSKWKMQNISKSRSTSSEPGFQLFHDTTSKQDLPSIVPKSKNALQTPSGISTVHSHSASLEPAHSMSKPMYDKQKVYGGPEELSLEEIRAIAWFKKQEVESKNVITTKENHCIKDKKSNALVQQDKVFEIGPALGSKTNGRHQSDENIFCVLPDTTDNSKSERNILETSRKSPIKELHSETNFTATYKDASYMVREMYNSTLPHPVNSNLVKASLNLEKSAKSSFSNNSGFDAMNGAGFHKNADSDTFSTKNTPLLFYHDPTEKLHVLGVKNSENCVENIENLESIDKENCENIPPEDYIQENMKRELSGILQPSKNVVYISLDQQEREEENSDSEEDIFVGSQHAETDVTLCPPCNTEQFMSADFKSSTPHSKSNRKSKMVGLNPTEQVQLEVQDKITNNYHTPASCVAENLNAKQGTKTAENQSTFRGLPTQLSVIMETSRETYKSSSTSGSSVGSTKFSQLELCLTQEKSNIQRFGLSRSEAVKKQNLSNRLSHGLTQHSTFPSLYHGIDPSNVHCVDIDPFDTNLNAERLTSMGLSSLYTNLQELNKSIKHLKTNDTLEFGSFSCSIGKMVSEGAFGQVFEAECYNLSNSGKRSKVAVKVCTRVNEWEFYVCTVLQERLQEVADSPNVRISVMDILLGQKYIDGMVLVSEFSKQGTLLDLVNKYRSRSDAVPELLTMYLAWELLHIVSKIHQCKIVHADIKPENILIRNDFRADMTFSFENTCFLQMIDFGVAIDLTFFKPGVCFKTVRKEKCCEMRDSKPWVYQLDWYGVLNCIHVLLFHEFMDVKKNSDGKWHIEKKFKRYWCVELWNSLFDDLLNIPQCYQQPNISKHTNFIESRLKRESTTLRTHFAKFM